MTVTLMRPIVGDEHAVCRCGHELRDHYVGLLDDNGRVFQPESCSLCSCGQFAKPITEPAPQ